MQEDFNKIIVERFEMNLFSFISEYLEKKNRFLLAVSGGVDSMVLLDLFMVLSEKNDIEFCVANLDHGIRFESTDEQSWLKSYCEEAKIPFFGRRVNIPALKREAGAKKSVEQIAREQRYAFFEDVKQGFSADWVLTAHHKDDLLETFFLRLLRGTGLNGLNILNKVDAPFMRPLIDFWRNEIEWYSSAKHLRFFEDITNKDNKYMRNKIRNLFIPFVCSEFGEETKDILIRNLQNFKSSVAVINEYLEVSLNECVFSEDSVQFQAYLIDGKSDQFREEFILRLYQRWHGSPWGLTNRKITDIVSRLHFPGDFEITISKNIRFMKTGDIFKFEKNGTNALSFQHTEVEFDSSFKKYLLKKNVICYNLDVFISGKEMIFKLLDSVDFDNVNNEEIYLDFEKLRFPLKLRFWKEGDRFRPFGMNGMKRVSRFYTDMGITKYKKREQLILEDLKHDIICCVGLRSSEDYKVCETTKKILKIEYK